MVSIYLPPNRSYFMVQPLNVGMSPDVSWVLHFCSRTVLFPALGSVCYYFFFDTTTGVLDPAPSMLWWERLWVSRDNVWRFSERELAIQPTALTSTLLYYRKTWPRSTKVLILEASYQLFIRFMVSTTSKILIFAIPR